MMLNTANHSQKSWSRAVDCEWILFSSIGIFLSKIKYLMSSETNLKAEIIASRRRPGRLRSPSLPRLARPPSRVLEPALEGLLDLLDGGSVVLLALERKSVPGAGKGP
jgi:hypothetical protein